ncbi:phage shock protein C, PspC [Actinobacteria bacterium OK074]|nr:phage shock protein C, PspC [Actinobacteria bacterium OK074]
MTDHEHAAPQPGTGPGQPGTGTDPSAREPGLWEWTIRPVPDPDGEPRAREYWRGEGAGPAYTRGNPSADAEADTAAGAAADAAAGSDATPAVPPPRFRRDRRYQLLGGVCAGLGRQCDMDPVIFRIVLAVLSATGGLGLIFYGFAWLFVPYEDEEENEVRKLLTGRVDGPALTAVLFALVGCGVFLSMLSNFGVLAFATVLSLLLAGAGYWSRRRGAPDPDPLAAQTVADAPPEAKAPPVPTSYPSWWRDPIVKDGTHVGGTGYLWGPSDARARDVAAAVNIARGGTWDAPPGQDIRGPGIPAAMRGPKPRGPRWIGGWLFLLALLAGSLGTRLTWDDHTLGTSLETGLSCALGVLGLGIAISAFLGRTGAGSILLAVLTAGLLAATAAMPDNITTHWVRTTWAPTSAAAVERKYELGSGVGTLDLTGVEPAKGRTVTTDAEVGLGRLKVVLPAGATAKLDIRTGIGDIQLPGDKKQDVDVEPDKHTEVTLTPTDGTSTKKTGTFVLHLKVGAGQVEVARAAS